MILNIWTRHINTYFYLYNSQKYVIETHDVSVYSLIIRELFRIKEAEDAKGKYKPTSVEINWKCHVKNEWRRKDTHTKLHIILKTAKHELHQTLRTISAALEEYIDPALLLTPCCGVTRGIQILQVFGSIFKRRLLCVKYIFM